MKLLLGFGLLYLFALLCEPSESQSCGLRSVVPVSQAHIIYVSNEDEYCKPGSVPADSASVDSAKEILQSINMNSSLSFGLQVLPLCHLNQVTRVQIGAKILQQLPPVDQCQPTIPENSTSSLIGVIAPFHLNLQDVLGETDIPLVTLGETSANDESAENVFYTSNSLIFRAKAMAQLAVKLNWDYTTVAYGSDPVSHELKALLEEELKANLICVDEYFEFSDTSAAGDIASRISNDAKPKAVIVIGLKNGVILTHDRSDSLEWIVSPYLPETKPLQYSSLQKDSVHIVQHHHPDAMPIAIRLLATSAQNIINRNCSKQFDLCDSSWVTKLPSLVNQELQDIELDYSSHSLTDSHYQNVSRRLRFSDQFLQINDTSAPAYHQMTNNDIIAEFTVDDGWNFESREGSNQFWCTDEVCRSKCKEQIKPKNFTYVHGDFILVVTMPIHDSFNKYPDLWSCEAFNNETSLRAEAALFARERLNELFREDNFTFGLLILDTCFNTALTQKLLTDVLNGTTEYCNEEHCLDRSKIVGLIGDYSSHISTTEQALMIPANLIQVAYGASTWKLDDKSIHTHFLRTHPTATRVTNNLIKVLEDLNQNAANAINSAVVLSTNSLYGKSGAELMKVKLNESNYCLLEEFELNYQLKEYHSTYENIISSLKKHNDNSQIIIYIGEEKAIKSFLDHITSNTDHSNWWQESGNIFLMAEVWEDRLPLLQQYGHLTRGSLTFKITPNFETDGFKEYLLSLRPNPTTSNPWFAQMYQNEKHCKLRGSFESSYVGKVCKGTSPFKETFNIEIYALYTIKSIYAFGYGFLNYAVNACPDKLYKTCATLYARTLATSQELKRFIGNVSIPISDSAEQKQTDDMIWPFDDNFDGQSGYQVFSHQRMEGTQNFTYVLAYEFDTADILENKNPPAFYKKKQYDTYDPVEKGITATHCHGHCQARCSTTEYKGPGTPAMKTPTIIAIVLGVIVVILVAGFVVYHFKKSDKKDKTSPRESTTLSDTNSGVYEKPESTYPTETAMQNSSQHPAATAQLNQTSFLRQRSEFLTSQRLLGPGSVLETEQTNLAFIGHNSLSLSTILTSAKHSDKTSSESNGVSVSDNSPPADSSKGSEHIYAIPTTEQLASSQYQSIVVPASNTTDKPKPLPRQQSSTTSYSLFTAQDCLSSEVK